MNNFRRLIFPLLLALLSFGAQAAILVGNDTAYTVETGALTQDSLIYYGSGFVAEATGTGTSLFVRIGTTIGWSASTLKGRVYDSSGALLAEAIWTSAQGSDWISASLDTPISITSGQTYYIAIIPENNSQVIFNSGTGFECLTAAGAYTYTNPPATITPGSDSGNPKANFNVYVDGTVSGGGGNLLLRRRRG